MKATPALSILLWWSPACLYDGGALPVVALLGARRLAHVRVHRVPARAAVDAAVELGPVGRPPAAGARVPADQLPATAVDQLGVAAPELLAEEAVDDRIDAAVERAEPLRDGHDGLREDGGRLVARRVQPVAEVKPEVERVERQPGEGEDNDDGHQHPQHLHLRLEDDARHVRHARRVAVPHATPDEGVAGADEDERQ